MNSSSRKPVTAVGVNRALMAVGAHADDIEINVGGTLSKYHDAGYEIDYVMSTNNFSGAWKLREPDGSLKRESPPWDRIMPKRKEEAAAAAALVGAEPVHLDHPQRHFINAAGRFVELRYGVEQPGPVGTETPTILTAHEDPASVKRLADLIVARNPEAVLVHGMVMGDLEHVGTCLLTTKAYWKAVERGYQGMLLHWHDVGSGIFGDAYGRWDTYVDVSGVWQRKLDWIGVHACMIPTPAEIEYASREVVCGCAQAEVFNIVSRGRRYFDNAPFGAELRTHASR
jgi:LmbE family N-acetylglucosaminyl deacetylase